MGEAGTSPQGTPPQNVPDPNKAAAHYFLSELRTRITTQPLPYQHGDEARALASLWEVFGQAREAMKKYPGCNEFADKVTKMLNKHLRPVTAKWHRAQIEGRLASRDGADEFRGDLAKVQEKLRDFATELHTMAYAGAPHVDELTSDAIENDKIIEYFSDVVCGIREIPPGDDPENQRKIDSINSQFREINKAERAALKRRRYQVGLAFEPHPDIPEKNAIGLALSGGGIRSATFCLGVVQELAKRELFREIDFLSTVSGGGYAGSFITTRLGGGAAEQTIAGPNGPDPSAIRYLRQHAKYLAALNLKQAWLMVTATLAGMLYNWMAPLSVVIFAALLISTRHWFGLPSPAPWLPHAFISMAVLSALVLLAYGALLSIGIRRAPSAGNILAVALGITLGIAALWLLQNGYVFAIDHLHWKTSGLVATLITACPAIIRFVPVVKNPTVRKIALQVLLWLAAVIVPLCAIALFYALVYLTKDSALGAALLLAGGIVCVILTVFFLNINLTGPHRLYRDQLARTFVQTDEANDAPVALSGINPSGRAPYHLINTTLNVPNGESPALRDRKSDFFLFSREYCGAPAIGYFKTTDWKTNAKAPDLATAMAISGAAASSYMGLGSMPTLTALLTFLNVRLGFWIKQPNRWSWGSYPGFSA